MMGDPPPPSLVSFQPGAQNALSLSVSEPMKHGEGSSSFVTYMVRYKVKYF